MTGLRDLFERTPLPPLAPLRAEDVARDLGGGLVLRRARPEDADAIAAFNRCAHADPPDYAPEEHAFAWSRELLEGRHPRMSARDFTVVEELATRRVVSSLCLVSQRFRFRGDPVGVGQIELVGTHPDFRRKGLVRAQMELVHGWSDDRGELAQVIDGIPGYYRQFGYEMALEVGGSRRYPRAAVEKALAEAAAVGGGAETPDGTARSRGALRGRAMGPDDVDLLGRAYDRAEARSAVFCLHDEPQRRLELGGRPGSLRERHFRALEDAAEPRVVLGVYPILLDGVLHVTLMETLDGTPVEPFVGAVLGDLHERALALSEAGAAYEAIVCQLSTAHPFYDATGLLAPRETPAYAAYLRVPNVGALLRALAPGIEARLAASELRGHDGVLSLSQYRRGWRLRFETGRLAAVEPWQPSTEERGDARFPEHSLLHLLTGHRSRAELEAFYPDCGVATDAHRALLDVLFPKQASHVLLAD